MPNLRGMVALITDTAVFLSCIMIYLSERVQRTSWLFESIL